MTLAWSSGLSLRASSGGRPSARVSTFFVGGSISMPLSLLPVGRRNARRNRAAGRSLSAPKRWAGGALLLYVIDSLNRVDPINQARVRFPVA